jgi:hypothetical protein
LNYKLVHLEMQNKLQALLRLKEREKQQKAIYIEYIQRLVIEIKTLKVILHVMQTHRLRMTHNRAANIFIE